MDNFFAELARIVQANAVAILALAGTIVTAVVALRSKSQDTRVGVRRLDVDSQKVESDARLAAEKLTFDRDRAVDERMDRLIAHLERQHEQAQKERDELRVEVRAARTELTAATKEISWLRQRVGDLVEAFRSKGYEPPPERPRD